PQGNLVLPGIYSVSMAKVVNGKVETLPGSQSFEVKLWNNATLAATDRAAVQGFIEKVRRLRRAASGAGRYQGELQNRIRHLKVATQTTPGGAIAWMTGLKDLEDRLQVTNRQLNGDRSVAQRQFETLPGINGRLGSIAYNLWQSTSAPTKTQQDSYRIAAKAFTGVLAELKAVSAALEAIEQEMETAGAPWTPGRLPVWEEE
ncbi:MAG: glycosyl hydrolase, partial [Bacteroidota bacterium]